MKNPRSSEDRRVKKTPYPTELEVILFLADVFDVREKGKRLYKESHKPFRHMYYELSDLVREIIEIPLKKILGSDVACELGPTLSFGDLSHGIAECVFRYGEIVHEINVGDLQRDELIPVLIEELFVPLAAYFICHDFRHHSLVCVGSSVLEYKGAGLILWIRQKGTCLGCLKVVTTFRESSFLKSFQKAFLLSFVLILLVWVRQVGMALRE